ncbi:hypothetical protein H7171_01940 [Candidatus Saccharibacteria bacterium]|nr:hypothetical protein [Candidatus Saccharibacteria bacterium]
MIATTIFSIILIVITFGVTSFTNDYYKGLNSSSTQNAVGTISTAVTQAIEFGESSPVAISGTSAAWCIGNQAFIYNLGSLVVSSGSSVGLAQASVSGCGGTVSTTGSHEMLQANMRVVTFDISQLPDKSWSLHIKVAHGENDLLCWDYSSCTSSVTATDHQLVANAATLHCRSSSGSRFCAVSELSTTVQRRLE